MLLRDTALTRDVVLVCLADGIIAVSFGASCIAGGLPWWVPVAMSVLVFAGGAQITAVGVTLAGGSPVAAVAAGAVLNTRLFPYGLAVADVLWGSGPGSGGPDSGTERWWRRWGRLLAGAHVITDESVAFAVRSGDPGRRRAGFWTCGVTLFVAWNACVVLGVLLGTAIHDTSAFGLDATFPAVMLALALPSLRDAAAWRSAGAGAVIAVALTTVLPAGLPVLAALGGLGVNWRPGRAVRAGGGR